MKRAKPAPSTMLEHLREVRTRLFVVAAVFIASSLLAYVFRDPIITALLSPLHGQKLIYLNPAGGFNFIFLISLYIGVAFTIPLLLQQIYSFVRPVLPKVVKHYSLKLFISSFALLIAGMAFGYFVAIPGALGFLTSFADTYVTASLTADSYLNFVAAYTLGIGLVFQLPLILVFIHWIHPLTPSGLLKSERWVVVLAFVAAALITPTPDPLNQTIIAVPIIAVYQLGFIAVLIMIHKSKKAARRAKTQSTPAPIPSHSQIPAPAKRPTQPVFQQAVVAQPTPQPSLRKSIDGFARMNVPARPAPSPRPARRSSPRFSPDGISARPTRTSYL